MIERIKKEDSLKKEEKEEVIPVKNGVEIIDAKVKPKVDKFGIPVPKNRLNWDRL